MLFLAFTEIIANFAAELEESIIQHNQYGTRRCIQEDCEPLQGIWLRLSK
jgi:hypothetical protein